MAVKQDIFKPTLATGSAGKSVLIISADKVQDLEIFYPYYRLVEEGYNVVIASPKGGTIKGEAGWEINDTQHIDSIDPAQFDLLFIPGGKAPQELRKNTAVTERVPLFAAAGKPIAAFCHGPQVLIDAGLVKGKTLTAYPEVEKEIVEAGGFYVNKPLVEDEQFITSRWPGDLPGHTDAILKRLERAQSRDAGSNSPIRKVSGTNY